VSKNIVLCGFMGSGKSVTGKLIAEKLGFTFVDMDSFLEKQSGMSVNDIFKTLGEPSFRRMETEAAKQLGQKDSLVIATGGGAVLNPQNVNYLKANGIVFLLDVTADTVKNRLKNDASRPLLAKDKENTIENLLSERKAAYLSAADYIIDSNSSKFCTADDIIKIYNSVL